MTTVAIQGEEGSYSHEAALQALGAGLVLQSHSCIASVFSALDEAAADYAVVPVENTIVGPIAATVELLRTASVRLVGHVNVDVNHCLIGRPGSVLADVRRVASHPVALAQCRDILARNPEWEVVAVADTAGAVRELARAANGADAAIASRRAAALHGCHVLREGIQDQVDNVTRFAVLRPARLLARSGAREAPHQGSSSAAYQSASSEAGAA